MGGEDAIITGEVPAALPEANKEDKAEEMGAPAELTLRETLEKLLSKKSLSTTTVGKQFVHLSLMVG